MISKEIQTDAENRMKQTVAAYKKEISHIRTGQASPSLVEGIKVDYYGSPTLIQHMAAIHVPEARLLVIQPWDKSTIDLIMRAIMTSELGINPSSDGNVIRLSIPTLTEERRKDLVKSLNKTTETYRVTIRNIRRETNDFTKETQKTGDMTEDELHQVIEEVQKLTDKYIDEIDKAMKAKEEEILKV